MKFLVPQKNVRMDRMPLRKIHLVLIAALAIHGMIIPIVFLDVTTFVYQQVYFSIFSIPKISRKKYVKFTRHALPQLSVVQKWSCWYCEYTNGVLSWAKAVANQTEVYSCAIKYSHTFEGQEYQEHFYEQEKFKETETKQ